MRKLILFFVTLVLIDGSYVGAAMAASQLQTPGGNALLLSCARVNTNGSIQFIGITQGCGYDTWKYQYVGLDHITNPGSSITVQWGTYQPANSSVCVRPVSYHADGATYRVGSWECGAGVFSQSIVKSGGPVVLEVALSIARGYAGMPAITSMQQTSY